MEINQFLKKEWEQETMNTKKIISAVPEKHFNWAPHEKSMNLLNLAYHIVEIIKWPDYIVNENEFNLANYDPLKYKSVKNISDLINLLDKNISDSISALGKTSNEDLNKIWQVKNGDIIMMEMPKISGIRTFSFNHLYHHRGQLSVYLRLLNEKVPGMYGPSADDHLQ